MAPSLRRPYPRLNIPLRIPLSLSACASHKQLGVLPVPPTVRLPTLSTGFGNRTDLAQPSANMPLRNCAPIAYKNDNGRNSSQRHFPTTPWRSQTFRIESFIASCAVLGVPRQPTINSVWRERDSSAALPDEMRRNPPRFALFVCARRGLPITSPRLARCLLRCAPQWRRPRASCLRQSL